MWMWVLSLAWAGPEVALGTSLSGGGGAHIQDGITDGTWSADVLDFEIHAGAVQVVPRLGTFIVGIAALQIVDIQVDVMYDFSKREDGWTFLGAGGVGPRLTVGGDRVFGGARLIGRLGATWRKPDGRFRAHLYGEPYAGITGGSEMLAGDVGVRLGAAFTWRVGK